MARTAGFPVSPSRESWPRWRRLSEMFAERREHKSITIWLDWEQVPSRTDSRSRGRGAECAGYCPSAWNYFQNTTQRGWGDLETPAPACSASVAPVRAAAFCLGSAAPSPWPRICTLAGSCCLGAALTKTIPAS